MKESLSFSGRRRRDNAYMSNVERSYNTSRRIQEGSKENMLNSFGLKRSLRYVTKVSTDEYFIERPIIIGSGKDIFNTVP